ncbi:pseudouridine synthase [Fodinicola acaciae]|uniref:pseudouridine synthase n=1 Tax=Fodinicola acaciae TaxID=2681555 RepID=UPI001FEA1E94|nr:pseudouridine synthase [Fodinicola acaciae]
MPTPQLPDEGERLQKVLAGAGVGSRRACEELIADGRVKVDGKVVSRLGTRVDPRTAVIHVDGKRVMLDDKVVHLALNKPRGVLSTMSDEQSKFGRARPTVYDYVAERSERLFHVGRLDVDSEGLLLMMNDGELAHRLTHPSYEVDKTYMAEVPGPVKPAVLRRLLAGVELEDGPVKVHKVRISDTLGQRAVLELVLHEGRKHIVKRLLAEVGHPVSRLVRTRFGPIRLGHQRPGTVRRLTSHEVADLYKVVDL